MQLFYIPELNLKKEVHFFTPQESRHIIKVLRKGIGDKLDLTDGRGLQGIGEIVEANHNCCQFILKEYKAHNPPSHKVHLAVAPTKSNERYEWFVEKATEIGITDITPIICERSERKTIKIDRLNKVAITAMKQSIQYHLPKIHNPSNYYTFITENKISNRYIAHCIDDNKILLRDHDPTSKEVLILIGPEGDFTKNEILRASKNGFIGISLGSKRLRTETAAIVACHTISLANETL